MAKTISIIGLGGIGGYFGFKLAQTYLYNPNVNITFVARDETYNIIKDKGLVQVSDTGAIDAMIDAIIAANPHQVMQYRGGKENLFGFFVGHTMKASQGQANPKIVNERLKAKLAL